MIYRRRDHRPPDDCGSADDEAVTAAERSEPRDPRALPPPVILIRREAAMVADVRVSFHCSPLGGTYHDSREDRRREQAEAAAQARRRAWAERHAAMTDQDRRHP